MIRLEMCKVHGAVGPRHVFHYEDDKLEADLAAWDAYRCSNGDDLFTDRHTAHLLYELSVAGFDDCRAMRDRLSKLHIDEE